MPYLILEASDDTGGPFAIRLNEGQPLRVYPGLRILRAQVAHSMLELVAAAEDIDRRAKARRTWDA